MADRDYVEKKILELNVYMKELEKLRNLPYEEIESSMHNSWAVEHGLLITIQMLIDIGNYILASSGDSRVENYMDVFDKLGENNVIPEDFARRIRGMAGFRNLLVHEYSKVDLRRVWEILQNNLEDFRKFAGYIRDYLDKI